MAGAGLFGGVSVPPAQGSRLALPPLCTALLACLEREGEGESLLQKALAWLPLWPSDLLLSAAPFLLPVFGKASSRG